MSVYNQTSATIKRRALIHRDHTYVIATLATLGMEKHA